GSRKSRSWADRANSPESGGQRARRDAVRRKVAHPDDQRASGERLPSGWRRRTARPLHIAGGDRHRNRHGPTNPGADLRTILHYESSGHIEVQSTLGQGSSFKIYLPAAEQTEADHESRNNSAETAFSGETVLVVEDAKPLRGLICEALSASGCTVLSARDGREASQIVNE